MAARGYSGQSNGGTWIFSYRYTSQAARRRVTVGGRLPSSDSQFRRQVTVGRIAGALYGDRGIDGVLYGDRGIGGALYGDRGIGGALYSDRLKETLMP
eukprot:1011283-Prorocentrum_minimum.AAC.1